MLFFGVYLRLLLLFIVVGIASCDTTTLSITKHTELLVSAHDLKSLGVKLTLHPEDNEVEPHMIFFAAMLEALLAPVEHTVTACGEVKVRQKMFYNTLKLQKNKFGSTVVDESVFSVDLDFCTQPGTALEKFIEETTTVVNTLFPPKDHPGYLDFVTKIFVVLITMKGTIDEKPTFNEKRIELFLESYLTAVGYGIKDNISNANRDHQPALFCYVQELMSRHKANAMMCARATFDLLRALNHETKKPAK